jgi:tetratricopeptide (TPR) repeat protein
MTDDELENLIQCAMEAHKQGRFEDELALWEQVCAERPDRLDFLHNVALARMNIGHLEQALTLFDDLASRAPNLSRVHNNRAALLVRFGADIQHLLPAFMTAVYQSETSDDFARHVLNAYRSAAFGPDAGGEELLNLLEEPILKLVGERFAPEDVSRNTECFKALLDAYRYVARYRVALSQKEWKAADKALSAAQDAFRALGLPNFAEGSDAFREHLLICRDVFGFLEDVGSDPALFPSIAMDRATALISKAATLRVENEAGIQQRLIDILGWFLNLFLRQLALLSGTIDNYEQPSEEVRIMMWLSSSSFRSIGDDLLTVINFGNRRCVELDNQLGTIASPATANLARREEWAKIALCIHGRVFDFRGVDSALAHAILGWSDDALGRVRAELAELRDFVERQAHADIIVDGTPRENIARALIQARLSARNYREVPVRGGRSDVLVFISNRQRVLLEVKIWRGAEYHEQGLRELEEYIAGENDDKGLLAAFYVVFDATEGAKGIAHEGSAVSTRTIGGVPIDVLIIRLRPPAPSRAGAGGSRSNPRVAQLGAELDGASRRGLPPR